MPDLDLEPDEVRERYDVKPMSRWWLAVPVLWVLLGLYVTGFTNPLSYSLILSGMSFMGLLIMVFPRHFLRRRDD